MARIPISRIAHPLDARMSPTVAAPVGQCADFNLILDAETLIHVREFERHYEAQLCSVITVTEPRPKPKLAPQREPEPEPVSASEPKPDEPFVAVGSNAPNALLHAARDAPAITVLGVTAMGTLLGAVLSGDKNGAAAGALIAGCAGLAAVSLATAELSPETAQLAKEMFHSVVTHIGRQPTPRNPIHQSAPTGGLPKGKPSGRKPSKQ